MCSETSPTLPCLFKNPKQAVAARCRKIAFQDCCFSKVVDGLRYWFFVTYVFPFAFILFNFTYSIYPRIAAHNSTFHPPHTRRPFTQQTNARTHINPHA